MLGKNIKELRIERGLTQAQLGKRIGVSQGAVYFWEKEINEPTASYLVALASVFEITTDELLSYECNGEKTAETSSERELIKLYMTLPPSKRELVLTLARELSEK